MNFRYLYIPFFFFLFSCDFNEEAIPVADINQDELKYKKFELNTSESILYDKIIPMGKSHLLYSGFLNDSSEVFSLFKIDREIFANYDLCANDSISYNSIYMVIDLINDYQLDESSSDFNNSNNNFGDSPSILAYWINHDDIIGSQNIDIKEWTESDSIYFHDISISSLSSDKKLFLEKYQGKFYIRLSDKIISESEDDSIFNSLNICHDISDSDEEKFILIKSNPSLKLLHEFASSNYTSDYSNTEPYLNIVYNEFEETTIASNKIMLSDYSSYQNSPNILFISDSLSSNFNNIFVSNSFIQNGNNQINDSLIWSDYNFDTSINLNNDSTINLSIKVDLVNLQNFQDSGITLWLDNIKYIEFIADPNGDNWSEDATEGTEGNNLWDAGEYLEDFGLDLCKDTFEDGQGGCVVDSTFSIYNILGTENNNIWDDGESYYDYGTDMCPDSYEDEAGGCICDYPDLCVDVATICDDSDNDGICDDGTDKNYDNYNIDPSEDNWFDINLNNEYDAPELFEDINNNNEYDIGEPFNDLDSNGIRNPGEGMEGNNKWDEGEIYLDIGLDGLESQLIGYQDEGEANGEYDEGEPFFDTGSDKLNNEDEPGWNIEGLQNNSSYQFGEIFNDCGIDADCNDNNILDDYIIDPNSDNWSDCGSDRLCPNDLYYLNSDEDGTELNGQWDVNEGTELNNLHDKDFNDDNLAEYYEDYGTDQLSDQSEQLYSTQKINISTSDTTFFNTQNEEFIYVSSDSNNNGPVKIEIQDIGFLDINNITLNVKISSNIPILGMEFRLNHNIYSNEVYDWIQKERNVAKIDSDKYISDISMYNDITSDPDKLYFNSAYGISSLLKFDSLSFFLNNKNIVINENNSLLKIYLDNNNSNFILESNQYVLNFEEIDEENIEKNLFSYYVQNNPDSLVIPLGSLLQKYINNEANFSNGLLIGLESNQYPPIFNFNNIILDSLKSPVLEVFYFE